MTRHDAPTTHATPHEPSSARAARLEIDGVPIAIDGVPITIEGVPIV